LAPGRSIRACQTGHVVPPALDKEWAGHRNRR
jgi:hypothetical protein